MAPPDERGAGRPPATGAEPFTPGPYDAKLVVPWLTGVYLAVNGVPDVYLVVDGPNCVFFRIPQIQGNHDWLADLARSSGRHRVVDTDGTPTRATRGDPGLLVERLREVDRQPDCRAILLTAMSVMAITGRQYDKLVAELDPPLDRPLYRVPEGSLEGDWIDGYAAVLLALARGVPLAPPAARSPDAVAVVGHLLHRREADAVADVAELRRLLAGLGLELCGVWLDGSGYQALGDVAQARWILSLPYGREAARVLAERTGAELLELPLPLGLAGTAAWLRSVGGVTGRQAEAERFVLAELDRVVPSLAWVLDHTLLGCHVMVGGDPYLAPALVGALDELGCTVVEELVLGRAGREAAPPVAGPSATALPRLVEPGYREVAARVKELVRGPGLDLLVSSSLTAEVPRYADVRLPMVEVGFPMYYTHAFHPAPTLGFEGVLVLVTRLVNALRMAEATAPDPAPG